MSRNRGLWGEMMNKSIQTLASTFARILHSLELGDNKRVVTVAPTLCVASIDFLLDYDALISFKSDNFVWLTTNFA